MNELRLVRAKYLDRRPDEYDIMRLRHRLQALVNPCLRVEWNKLEKGRADAPALIRLCFRGFIEIDAVFCSHFWGRVIPARGAGWILRAHAFDPEQRMVIAEPLPDTLNQRCANTWHDSGGHNPIASACLGFKYLYPFRDIEFPTQ